VEKGEGILIRNAEAEDFESTTGAGVEAHVSGNLIRAGKIDFLKKIGVSIPDAMREKAEALQSKAQTVIWISKDEKLLGLIAVADPIKETSKAAVKALHEQGVTVIMCTGDNERTAQAVAKEIDILYPFFGILLNPMIAGAAMSFSSVSVIGNALRLKRSK